MVTSTQRLPKGNSQITKRLHLDLRKCNRTRCNNTIALALHISAQSCYTLETNVTDHQLRLRETQPQMLGEEHEQRLDGIFQLRIEGAIDVQHLVCARLSENDWNCLDLDGLNQNEFLDD